MSPYYYQQYYNRLEAQHELARNFYDDFEFCPVQCSSQVLEHCERIQQRLSPQTSPASQSSSLPSSPKKRVIPIINPSNMTPVNIINPHLY